VYFYRSLGDKSLILMIVKMQEKSQCMSCPISTKIY